MVTAQRIWRLDSWDGCEERLQLVEEQVVPREAGKTFPPQVLIFILYFRLGGDYKGGGRIWENREISGIGVHDVKFPKDQ